MIETSEHPSEVEQALADEFRAAVADAQGRIAAVLDPACPTTEFLKALAAELRLAASDSSAVPYPELVDPDNYWSASVMPQAQAMKESVTAIVEWLVARVIATMTVAETDMKQIVDLAAADPGPNPVATRTELRARLEQRCNALYHQMAELVGVLPDATPATHARASYQESLLAVARADVDRLKDAYMREAGGDESHQQFAAEQWANTYNERVAHRQAMLAGAPPWRHQELALVGYERAWSETESLVNDAVARLQGPLTTMAGLLVERYDAAL